MEQEELIDKFLKGVLTQSEQDDWDNLLKTDPSFKNDVETLKNLKIVAGAEDREDLRKVVMNFESKIASGETKVLPLINYKKLLVAASVLLIIGFGIYKYFTPSLPNMEMLYAENFEPYRNVVMPMKRGKSNADEETQAFIAYESKDYETAATMFEDLFAKTKKPYFLLYQANTLLAIDNIEGAIPLLEQHIKFNDRLVLRGKWYLALAYLKNKEPQKSIPLLEDIVKGASYKQGAAKILLEKLE